MSPTGRPTTAHSIVTEDERLKEKTMLGKSGFTVIIFT